MYPLILLITTRNIQCRIVGCSLVLCDKERAVCCSEQTVGTGDHVELVVGILLSGMVYQQQTNAVLRGKRFQRGDDLIVARIAVIIAASFTNLLQGVYDHQRGIGVIPNEEMNLFIQTFPDAVG